MVKNVLKWIGIFLLGLIFLFMAAIAFTWYQKKEYASTAVPYINQVIPKISEWNPDEAKVFFAPSAFEKVSQEDFEKLFRWFSKLGSLKSAEEPEFNQVSSEAIAGEASKTIVTYTVLAHYDNGDAAITIRLLDLGSTFQVYHLNINSNALIE